MVGVKEKLSVREVGVCSVELELVVVQDKVQRQIHFANQERRWTF